jgi:hypothetical protein
MKITRSAFLYLEGRDDTFAQCGSCAFGKDRCAIMGNAEVSAHDGSCNFHIKGTPTRDRNIASLTRKQTGYVERQVRCQNCKFKPDATPRCRLYAELNRKLPEIFELDERISPYGCCNSQEPR